MRDGICPTFVTKLVIRNGNALPASTRISLHVPTGDSWGRGGGVRCLSLKTRA